MKVTENVYEFYLKTGMISNPSRLCELGLFNDDLCGVFEPEDADELLAFCAENPRFHIVTGLENATCYVNRYEKEGCVYKLAEGDADPDYMLDARAHIAGMLSLFIPQGKRRA